MCRFPGLATFARMNLFRSYSADSRDGAPSTQIAARAFHPPNDGVGVRCRFTGHSALQVRTVLPACWCAVKRLRSLWPLGFLPIVSRSSIRWFMFTPGAKSPVLRGYYYYSNKLFICSLYFNVTHSYGLVNIFK